MEFPQLKNVIEAALLAADKPLSRKDLAGLFRDEVEKPGSTALEAVLQALHKESEGRCIELLEVANGYRYQVRREYAPYLRHLQTERPARYSRALLETLAIIAYRQPVSRGEIEAIRGVSVASSILRTLEERTWIRVVGHRDVPGRPALYGTTRDFLDYFSLKNLTDLPILEMPEGDDTEPGEPKAGETEEVKTLDPEMPRAKPPAPETPSEASTETPHGELE